MYGARVGYTGPPDSTVSRNMPSALQNSAAVRSDIEREVKLGRMAGPFGTPPAEPFVSSPLGAVPKKGATASNEEQRRIHNLSHPRGNSVNDWIEPKHLTYATFDVSPCFVLCCARAPSPPSCPAFAVCAANLFQVVLTSSLVLCAVLRAERRGDGPCAGT